MELEATTIINGKILCLYCMKELHLGEECSCKAYQKAKAHAEKKALHAAANLPNHRYDRPPRGHDK